MPSLLAALDSDLRTHLRLLRQLRNAADYDTELSAETIALSTPDARYYATGILAALDRHRAAFESVTSQRDQSPDPASPIDQDA